jgi:hypothetical protein
MAQGTEGMWRSRLRWRLRGARLWPTFALFTVLDAMLLHHQPLAGDRTSYVGGFLLAGFFNIVAIGVLGRLGGRWLRRRRGDLPRVVAEDHAGTAAVLGVTVLFAAVGLAHRPARMESQRDFRAQSDAARMWVARHAEPQYRVRIDEADTWEQATDRYRTCVPGGDPRRALCLLIVTDQSPPGVTVDHDETPNSQFVGPDAPGHKRG